MTRKQLFKLNSLLYRLDNEYLLNNGGCCYAAIIIARLLSKLNIKYYIMITDSEPLDKFVFNRFVSVYHVYIHIPYIGDVNPIYNEFIKQYSISIRTLELYYRYSIWNSCYSKENNKIIRREIKSFFKDYDIK